MSCRLLQGILTDLVLVDSKEKRSQLFNYEEEHLFGLRQVEECTTTGTVMIRSWLAQLPT